RHRVQHTAAQYLFLQFPAGCVRTLSRLRSCHGHRLRPGGARRTQNPARRGREALADPLIQGMPGRNGTVRTARGRTARHPWKDLDEHERQWVIQGDPNWKGGANAWKTQWYGVQRFFDWLESRSYKMHVRV